MQMFSNAFFCDRKHHHDLVVLFQSFPSYLVRSIRHGLRLFICSSWSHNESDSFLFLNERIKYSRNSRVLPTYTARVGGSVRKVSTKYKTRTTAAVYRDRSSLSTSQASHVPLGENFCLKFPTYDTRSDMLSGKFPELRGHSGQYFW